MDFEYVFLGVTHLKENLKVRKTRGKNNSVPMVIQGRSFKGNKSTIEDIMLYILEDALKNKKMRQSIK